MSHNSCFAKKS